MQKSHAKEAVPLIETAMSILMRSISSRGREGSDVRTAIGDLLVHAEELLLADKIGKPLAKVFDLARLAGASLVVLDQLRLATQEKKPRTLGANIVRDALIQFALATQSRILADTAFANRQAVEAMTLAVNAAFQPAEEEMADAMDAMTYRAMVALHAATTHYLTETGRPLPRIVKFRFATPLPTLQASYRLYANAGRADEIRAENKVVHPAFMRPLGRALSS